MPSVDNRIVPSSDKLKWSYDLNKGTWLLAWDIWPMGYVAKEGEDYEAAITNSPPFPTIKHYMEHGFTRKFFSDSQSAKAFVDKRVRTLVSMCA